MAPTPLRAAGTRRPYRKGRMTKLPMMNNSERGKYYRQKYKEHELHLEGSVTHLRKQVHDLELFMQVRAALAFRNPRDTCESIVGMIYEYFARERVHGLRYETSFHAATRSEAATAATATATRTSPTPSASSAHAPFDLSGMEAMIHAWGADDQAIPSAFLFFDLLSFHVQGCVDAPVVVMRGMLHTKYTLPAIDRMFPHLLHYQDLLNVLLDKEVRYPCTYHFYFGSSGKFENKIVEADYVHGLQQVVESLEDVVWLLDGSHRYLKHRDSLDEILRGPTTMSLDYILA